MRLKITDWLDQGTLLIGLAEEASELSQAALKLQRVLEGKNPSNITKEEAIAHLNEEIADVRLYIDQISCVDEDAICAVRLKKLGRWMARLMERDGVGT